MLDVVLWRPGAGCREGGEELIEEWRNDPKSIVWLNTHDEPDDREQSLLERWFGLHRLGVQDAQRDRHPPKLEGFEDHTLVLLRGLDATSDTIEFRTIQIAMFVGERFLVTRHSARSISIERVRARLAVDPGLLGRGPDATALAVCRTMVERYLPILMRVEPRLDALEEEMARNPRDRQLVELIGLKSDLKKLRRIMAYHVQVFASLRAGSLPAIRGSVRHEINDVYEQIERAMSLASLFQDLAGDLIDGYLSLSAHRLNHVMKILTIVTAVFVPLGFLAGVYGMNFEYMPELKWRYAYFVALGTMTLIATTLLWAFWRKGWLRGA